MSTGQGSSFEFFGPSPLSQYCKHHLVVCRSVASVKHFSIFAKEFLLKMHLLKVRSLSSRMQAPHPPYWSSSNSLTKNFSTAKVGGSTWKVTGREVQMSNVRLTCGQRAANVQMPNLYGENVKPLIANLTPMFIHLQQLLSSVRISMAVAFSGELLSAGESPLAEEFAFSWRVTFSWGVCFQLESFSGVGVAFSD